MSETTRSVLILLGAAVLAVAGFFGARYWQGMQDQFTRIAPPSGCDLRAGPCAQQVDGGSVTLAIAPSPIPLMQPLRLSVVTDGLTVDEISVEIRGLNMDMGLNRTRLTPVAGSHWEGETILPLCSQRRMEWEAAVLLRAKRRLEVPFRFHTQRP